MKSEVPEGGLKMWYENLDPILDEGGHVGLDPGSVGY